MIFYHTHDKLGLPYITCLLEKGYENVYYLSGGIEGFTEKYSDKYINGEHIPNFDAIEQQQNSTIGKSFSQPSFVRKVEIYRRKQPEDFMIKNKLPSIYKNNFNGFSNKNLKGKEPEINIFGPKGSDDKHCHRNMSQDNRWKDISDSHSQSVSHVNLFAAKTNRNRGRKDQMDRTGLTEKPSNLWYCKDQNAMIFRERKLAKIDEEITDKVHNNRNPDKIPYTDYYS